VGILTGASRGIGRVLAEHLPRKGVDLALAARSRDTLDETAEQVRAIARRAVTVPTDACDRDSSPQLVDTIGRELGPVVLLVNNAGVEHHATRFWNRESLTSEPRRGRRTVFGWMLRGYDGARLTPDQQEGRSV
jgi:short-subunit dehydrogenase